VPAECFRKHSGAGRVLPEALWCRQGAPGNTLVPAECSRSASGSTLVPAECFREHSGSTLVPAVLPDAL